MIIPEQAYELGYGAGVAGPHVEQVVRKVESSVGPAVAAVTAQNLYTVPQDRVMFLSRAMIRIIPDALVTNMNHRLLLQLSSQGTPRYELMQQFQLSVDGTIAEMVLDTASMEVLCPPGSSIQYQAGWINPASASFAATFHGVLVPRGNIAASG